MPTAYLTAVCLFQEEKSVSSSDFSGTDLNYTPPAHDETVSTYNIIKSVTKSRLNH